MPELVQADVARWEVIPSNGNLLRLAGHSLGTGLRGTMGLSQQRFREQPNRKIPWGPGLARLGCLREGDGADTTAGEDKPRAPRGETVAQSRRERVTD